MHSPNTTPNHASPRVQYNTPQSNGGFLGIHRNTPFQGDFGRIFYMHSIYMTLVNLQEKFGKDLISGWGILGGNSPFFVASIKGYLSTDNL